MEDRTPSPDALEAALRLLEAIDVDRGLLAGVEPGLRRALLAAAGRVSRPERDARTRLARAFRRGERRERLEHDARLVEATALRTARRAAPLPLSPPPPVAPADDPTAEELREARSCYVCKRPFLRLHFFYDSLCPPCAALNWDKRHQLAPLDGRVALITGARLKIGFRAALLLLRAGAHVIATTRFPRDAARRYAGEPDFAAFAPRLALYGLDLRHAPSVELFARHLEATSPRLDVLVNNAAQTVRRPRGFYAHLLAGESAPLGELPAAARPLLAAFEALRAELGGPAPAAALGPTGGPGLLAWHGAGPAVGLAESARLSQVACTDDDLAFGRESFPPGLVDGDLQQVDLRDQNSWRLRADQVSTPELLEVHLVNAVAPFILTSRLRSLFRRHPTGEQHVVNVSAMEAQFARRKKTDKHPHTNMAKAALNMLTRTSASDYARDGIHMNSVDTGWVTDEDPLHHAARKQRLHDFHPPLDALDGAARVCDPLFSGLLTGRHAWGLFFKDYRPTAW